MREWRAGEKVRLKSGGPVMTVRRTDDTEPGSVVCDWLNGGEAGSFHSDELEPAPNPPRAGAIWLGKHRRR
jgi:uncharacterized protein YodC (DUF2158 family)